MKCDGTPDPTVLTEINTYINLTKDSRENDIDKILEEAKAIYALMYELNFLVDDTPPEDITPEQERLYKSTILALQDLLIERYNNGTLKILREAIYEADTESGNLQKVIHGEHEVIMLWGNLNKNPRFKSFKFESEDFTFELPKPLAMAEIAIRNLRTQYDFYSHQCSTFYAKPKKPKAPESIAAAAEEVATVDETLEDNSERKLSQDVEERRISIAAERRKSNQSEASGSAKNANEKEGEEAAEDQAAEDGDDQDLVNTDDIQGDDLDDDILDEDVIDLRQYHQLGGIFHLDLVKLPPQAKTINGWTLRQVIDEPITAVEYPSEAFAPKQSASRTASAREDGSDLESLPKTQISEQTQPSVGITIKLPSNVMFFEEPQVAKWDEKDLHWKTTGINDTEYDEDTRTLSLKSRKFGTFCLMQDLHVNMPFQQWELRPLGQNHCMLTITAAIAEVFIEIKGTVCRLQAPEDEEAVASELKHLYEIWMTPMKLRNALQNAGVNIFPAEDSDKFVSIQTKDVDLENIYDQMALMSSCVAFTWSKWNTTVMKDQLIIQASPWLGHGDTRKKLVPREDQFVAPTPPPPRLTEDDWSVFMMDGRRAHKLQISEYDDEFTSKISVDAEYHSDIVNAVRLTPFPPRPNLPSKAQVEERLDAVDEMFVYTVMGLLKATKCLTYS